MPSFLKKKKVWIPLVIVLGIIVIVSLAKKPKAPEFSSAKVVRQDLVQSVEETGKVTAELDLTYGFEMNGKVIRVLKAVGDEVKKDEVIAEIDSTSQLQSLRQTQASLASARAALNLRLAGPSNEARAESEASVDKAKASLSQSEADLAKAKIQAQTDIDGAQKNLETAENNLRLVQNTGSSQIVDDAHSDLLNNAKGAISTLNSGITEADDVLGIDNKQANDAFEDALGIWSQAALNKANNSYQKAKSVRESAVDILSITSENDGEAAIFAAANIMSTALYEVRQLLFDTSALLDATPPVGITQSTLDTLKSGVTTELTAMSAAITSLTNAQQAVNEAKISESGYQIAFEKAKLDLETTKQRAATNIAIAESSMNIQKAVLAQAQAAHAKLIVAPREVDVGSLRADVLRYGASVASAQKEFDRTKLTAIADGVISKLDADIGENVSANEPIFGLISSDYTIEVDVSESDIAKIQTNDIVEITLDAFGDDVSFDGHVVSVEPSETEISGVIYYKTSIVFDNIEGSNIRPGMTANVRIITDTKPNVLLIPQRAILDKDGKKIVRVLMHKAEGTFEEKEVQTGIRGDEGQIEIVSGLSEDDEVITFLKEE